jgi:adenylate cyclase
MALEIERKFLVTDDSWRRQADAGEVYKQGYFAAPRKASIRVRRAGDHAWLNIKSAELGVRRTEYEYEIPVNDAEEMLASLCEHPLIEKTRYHVRHGGHVWEVDVFAGDNEGLVVAEIELGDENEPFELPPWAGGEVSHDTRYYNVSLVNHPYKTWRE